jgi:hypothetical protein
MEMEHLKVLDYQEALVGVGRTAKYGNELWKTGQSIMVPKREGRMLGALSDISAYTFIALLRRIEYLSPRSIPSLRCPSDLRNDIKNIRAICSIKLANH